MDSKTKKSKDDGNESKFYNLYDILNIIPNEESINYENTDIPNNEDELEEYVKNIINKLIDIDNQKVDKFKAAFDLHKVMNRLKDNYQDDGKSAKNELIKYFNKTGVNKHGLLKAAIRVFHFFNNGLLKKKNYLEVINHCTFSFRDFRILNESKWKNIAKKFEFENEYKIDNKYWRSINNYVELNKDSDSDRTITDE